MKIPVSSSNSDPVAVIGGGVVGVCCAYYLAKAGIPVALFETDEICSGCSLGNLGLLAASHSVPLAAPGVMSKALRWMFNGESPFAIQWRTDPQFLLWLWRFFRASRSNEFEAAHRELLRLILASMALFDEIAADKAGFSFALQRKGILELFSTSEEFQKAKGHVSWLRTVGLRVDLLEAAEVTHIEPLVLPAIRGALLYGDDYHLSPEHFVRGLAVRAQKAGAEIHDHSAVTDFVVRGERIAAVKTARDSISVSHVVLAAGSHSAGVAQKMGIRLPVQPARGYSYTIPAVAGKTPSRPIMFSEAKALLIPMGDRLRLGGVLELTTLGAREDRLRASALVRSLDNYLLPQNFFQGVEPWSGYRPCSPDGFPIVGWSRKWSNLLHATGHGMLGLTLGPLTGKIIQRLITKEDGTAQSPRVAPERFGLL